MMYNTEFAEMDDTTLEDYLQAIRARRYVVLTLAALGLLAGLFAFSRMTPTYRAEASVVLGPTLVGSTSDSPRAPVLEREAEVLTSDAVAAAVIDRLGLEMTPPELLEDADVSFLPSSEILDLEVTAGTGAEAAEIATTFASVYVEQVDAADQKLFQDRVDVLAAQATIALQAVNDAVAAVDALEAERLTLTQQAASDSRDALINDVDSALSLARTRSGIAVSEEREVSRQLAIAERELSTRVPVAQVLRAATVPESPTGLGQTLLALIGLIIGLVLGLVVAIVLDRLDRTARDERSVSLALGANVLSQVPRLPMKARSGGAALVMLSAGKSPRIQQAREAYRRLRSSAQFIATNQTEPGRPLYLMFTSAFPGEGKSVASANLSLSLAQAGSRVVLIDADMRRPSLEGMFGVPNTNGLSLFLGGAAELTMEGLGAVEIPDVPNLWLIPAGPLPSNPAELLTSQRFKAMLASLEKSVDYVIIDCPPVLSASDPMAVAPNVDGVVVVIDTRRTETGDLLQVRANLENSGAAIVGALLNRDKRRRGQWWRKDRYSYS